MNIISSIANPYGGQFVVCKSPIEDFNDNTILTVNPGEQAIFVNCGQIAAVYDAGRYELNTNNYPFINAWRRFLANGQLTYHCSIYFVSTTMSPEVLWGLSLPVRDPVQNIYTKIFARGSYNLRVVSGEKLLVSLLGMNVNFMAPSDVRSFFGNRIQQLITNTLGQYIADSGREVLDICSANIAVADAIQPKLQQLVGDTGFDLYNFAISALEIDVNDPNRAMLERAYAQRREIDILGQQYQRVKDTDVRINASQTSFAGMSFGTSQSSGQVPPPVVPVAPVAPVASAPAQNPQSAQNAPQGAAAGDDVVAKLQQLSQMLNEGLITQQDYDHTKEMILRSMYEN